MSSHSKNATKQTRRKKHAWNKTTKNRTRTESAIVECWTFPAERFWTHYLIIHPNTQHQWAREQNPRKTYTYAHTKQRSYWDVLVQVKRFMFFRYVLDSTVYKPLESPSTPVCVPPCIDRMRFICEYFLLPPLTRNQNNKHTHRHRNSHSTYRFNGYQTYLSIDISCSSVDRARGSVLIWTRTTVSTKPS